MSIPICKQVQAAPANAFVACLLPQLYAVLWYAVLCRALLCCAVPCCVMCQAQMLRLVRPNYGCSVGAFLFPICSTVCDLVPESRRKTTQNMLTVADLAKLPTSKLHQIYTWIIQHIHIQEMDHLMLSPDQTHLQMAPAWRTRLQSANEFAWNPQNQVCFTPVMLGDALLTHVSLVVKIMVTNYL